MNRHELAEQRRINALKLHQQGVRVSKIAQRLGISTTRTYVILNEFNVDHRGNSVWTPEMDATLSRMRSEKRTVKIIARAVGRTPYSVVARIRRLGLPPIYPKMAQLDKVSHGTEFDRALRELWGIGDSTRIIGAKLGVSKNVVIGRAHRLHLPSRPSPILGRVL